MDTIFNPELFHTVEISMAILAVIVFIALQKIEAAYGMTYSPKWGPSLGNRIGWIVMEAPAFFGMAAIWAASPRASETAPCVMALLFELHYFQRTFIFPMLMRGKNRMPLAIVAMGMIFNLINAYLLGGWLFFAAPADRYPVSWLGSPQFIIGAIVFFTGMVINIHSDHVIRSLRKPGDNGHYIPRRGLYRYVTGANYFGEFTEWTGFAILTWSVPGAVFALWTFANLAPRAKSLYAKYEKRFGPEFTSLGRKYIIPFIY
uniref:3-oxo-5-alpha-steroid 4-dehydrogenase 1 n=1 Tax=uncultured Muribaculaceae bacterium TaxID=2301481 RepID=A0A6G8F3N8_9BACT|nr:3-oxo-5-alpha-steroid 4-dehydrogenase [uncultured Muribaculaceae bacterium]